MAHQRIAAGVSILLLLSLVCASSAQDQSSSKVPRISLDVDVVLVNATVTEPERNRSVVGLNQEDFQVWEDKVEQNIAYFSSEDVPVSIGVIFDTSGSMKDKIPTAQRAAATYLRNGTSDDEYFQVQFSDRPQMTSDYTTDISKLQSQLLVPTAKGRTALYDAVYLGLNKLRTSRNTKKALLLITDGEDNRSRYSFANVRDYIREQDVQIYAIGILDPLARLEPLPGLGEDTLLQLTGITGGRAFFPPDTTELPEICRKIAAELKYQYVIGYRSTNAAKDGTWRKIKVKVTPPRNMSFHSLDVRARTGYLAAGGAPASSGGN